jgi:hypothetical protein
MNLSAYKYVLAGAIVLGLAPGWAVEATKGAAAQEAKVNKKLAGKSSEEVEKLREALKPSPAAIDISVP